MTVLGGLDTAGHIAIYLLLCNGMSNKVIGGIAEELLWESMEVYLKIASNILAVGNNISSAGDAWEVTR
jgi:hypothetical protein